MINHQKYEPISEGSSLYEFFNESNDIDLQSELDIVEDDVHRNTNQNDRFIEILPENINQNQDEDNNDDNNEDEDEDDDEESLPAGCCGLSNLGNTCYMNACIQALSNIQLFTEQIHKSTRNQKLLINFFSNFKNNKSTLDFQTFIKNNCFTKAFEITFETMWSDQYESITPNSIRNVTTRSFSQFNNNQQQDAEEYLLAILNKFDDELKYPELQINFSNDHYKQLYNKYIDLDSSKKKIFFDKLSIEDKKNLKEIISFVSFNKNYSPIQETFQFMTTSTICCSECNHSVSIHEPNIILETEIPKIEKKEKYDSTTYNYNSYNYNSYNTYKYGNSIYDGLIDSSEDNDNNETEPNSSDENDESKEEKNEYEHEEEAEPNSSDEDEDEDEDELTLKKCLNNFFKNETLTGQNKWLCEKCNKLVDATKKIKLSRIADVLIIQFKRFKQVRNSITKNQEEIKFPLEFNLKNYTKNGNDEIFSLKSVINHEGHNTAYGHYTTYAKNELDNKWYYFNDENVCEETNLDLIFDEDAYILFYERNKVNA